MDINAYISSGIIEEYALGITTEEQNSILQCVMKNNLQVQEAVLEAQETLSALSTAQEIAPPIELKEQIAARLTFQSIDDTTVLDKKVIQINETQKVKSLNRNFWAIAATVLLLVSMGWNVLNTTSKNTEIEGLAAKNNLLKTQIDYVENQNNLLLNSDKIKLLGVETHPELYATVLYSNSNEVYLKLDNLPAPPAGKEYQLWAIVDGAPVDLGMYNASNSDKLQAMKTVKNPQAFAITLENEGGSPTPTMEQMFVMGKVG